jgi:SEC-C motif-containing protein
MRSRYAAFALGLGPYLYQTLAAGHPDRAEPEAAFVRRLAGGPAVRFVRYVGLSVLYESADGDAGEVLFYARIFEKGRNVSFAELSAFAREGGAWRYESGVLVPHAALPADVASLTRERLLALAGGLRRSGARRGPARRTAPPGRSFSNGRLPAMGRDSPAASELFKGNLKRGFGGSSPAVRSSRSCGELGEIAYFPDAIQTKRRASSVASVSRQSSGQLSRR